MSYIYAIKKNEELNLLHNCRTKDSTCNLEFVNIKTLPRMESIYMPIDFMVINKNILFNIGIKNWAQQDFTLKGLRNFLISNTQTPIPDEIKLENVQLCKVKNIDSELLVLHLKSACFLAATII